VTRLAWRSRSTSSVTGRPACLADPVHASQTPGTLRSARAVCEVRSGRRYAAVLLLGALLVLTGCSTSKDAVAIGGTFQFVAPGGKTELTYDPPSTRGSVGPVSGPSLADPARTLALTDYPGKVVVLNVWGSWCGPCRTEAPNLEFVAKQEAAQGVAVLGIDVRDDQQAALDYTRSVGLTYDSISDYPGRSLAGLGGVPRNVVPLTVVLDKQHRVAFVSLVAIQVAQLIPLVQRLAAE
jgi:thiol-disulfide isomerase/thioredoxin